MLPAVRSNGSALAPTTGTPANRLATVFDRFFHDDPLFGPLMTAPAWSAMPLSVWEDEHSVHVEVDAPGVTDKDIDVSVHDGVLIVRGERKSEGKGGGYDTRTYGRFEQRVTLPCPVDADRVEAKLANGVLAVTFPKSEAAKPRKIAIKSE
jgi:HSP20 family protein